MFRKNRLVRIRFLSLAVPLIGACTGDPMTATDPPADTVTIGSLSVHGEVDASSGVTELTFTNSAEQARDLQLGGCGLRLIVYHRDNPSDVAFDSSAGGCDDYLEVQRVRPRSSVVVRRSLAGPGELTRFLGSEWVVKAVLQPRGSAEAVELRVNLRA